MFEQFRILAPMSVWVDKLSQALSVVPPGADLTLELDESELRADLDFGRDDPDALRPATLSPEARAAPRARGTRRSRRTRTSVLH